MKLIDHWFTTSEGRHAIVDAKDFDGEVGSFIVIGKSVYKVLHIQELSEHDFMDEPIIPVKVLRVEHVGPDLEMVKKAIEQYEQGDYLTSEEFLSEIKTREEDK